MAGLLVSGCASTRGPQDVSCARFDDFAIAPKPNAFVADIQRYVVYDKDVSAAQTAFMESLAQPESLGEPAALPAASQQSVAELVSQTAFGIGEAALKREGARLEREYTRQVAAQENARLVGPESLVPESRPETPAGAITDENQIIVQSSLPTHNILLLSGGGQWGAYGAGLFLGLACQQRPSPQDDRNEMPCMTSDADGTRRIDDRLISFDRLDAMNIGMITGVSTGSLQSLLLAVVLDQTQPRSGRIASLQQLLDSYAPRQESDLVDYDGFRAVIFKGSVAGTSPLRNEVRKVLNHSFTLRSDDVDEAGEPGGSAIVERSLVEHVGKSPIRTLVGVVGGADGEFKSVNLKRMVTELSAKGASRDEMTDCVLAATLASSAMPVFHQQLRVLTAAGDDGSGEAKKVTPKTLFDGGVRRSVFVSEIGNAFATGYAALAGVMSEGAFRAAMRSDTLPKVYVLRNGPTGSKPSGNVDIVRNARDQAMRAYTLLVNELEVGSIAALRLANPYGPIVISTADGSENREAPANGKLGIARKPCVKNDEMFNPEFMRCLQNFGARRGMGIELDHAEDPQPISAFWSLSEIRTRPQIKPPVAANDN